MGLKDFSPLFFTPNHFYAVLHYHYPLADINENSLCSGE
jgi:hypothetical protein